MVDLVVRRPAGPLGAYFGKNLPIPLPNHYLLAVNSLCANGLAATHCASRANWLTGNELAGFWVSANILRIYLIRGAASLPNPYPSLHWSIIRYYLAML